MSATAGGQAPDRGAVLARGAGVNLLTMLASNLNAVFTLATARLLGRSALGAFTLAWAITDVLVKLGTFGLDRALLALGARLQARGDGAGFRALLSRSLRWGVALSAVLTAVAVLAVRSLGPRLGQPQALVDATSVMLLAMPAITLFRVSIHGSRALRVMRHDLWTRGLTEPVVAVLALLVLTGFGLGFLSPVAAKGIGLAVAAALAYGLVRGLSRERPGGVLAPDGPGVEERAAPRLLRFATPIACTDLLHIAARRMDVLLLGAFVGVSPQVDLAAVGVYAAAVEVAGGLRKLRQVFEPILAPVVAMSSEHRDTGAVERAFGQVGRWQLAIALPLAAVAVLAAGPILMLFGAEFTAGASWLAILVLGHAVVVVSDPADTVLLVNRPALNLVNAGIGVGLQLGLSLVLIPLLGPLGAAVALAAASVLQAAVRLVQLRLLLGFHVPWGTLARPLGIALLAMVPALALRAWWRGPVGGLAAAAVFLVVYVSGWRRAGLQPEDRAALDALRGEGGA